MDDSERSYGYSKDIYHGNRGVGGHYPERRSKDAGPFYPGAPHFDRSYEYGAEGDPAEEPSPEEAAMHIEDRSGLRIGSPEAEPAAYDYDRHSSYGQVESFTWDMEGPYRGRGPKGYRRSDERIHEEICDRLTAHGAIDATGIEVHVDTGEVTLEGTVPDRRTKRLAEAVADTVRGVVDVHNRLRLA
jgi:BON domain-containing protein